MKTNQAAAIIVALTVIFGIRPLAQSQNLLENGSFETGPFVNQGGGFMLLAAGATNIAGWTVISDQLAWGRATNSDFITPAEGIFFLDLQGPSLFGSPYGGVAQSIATTNGQTYLLSFALGTQQAIANDRGPVSAMASAAGNSQTFNFAPTGSGVQWGQFGFYFVATNTSTTISIIGTLATGGAYIGLDNVSVVAAPDRPILSMQNPGGPSSATVRLTGQNGFWFAVDTSTNLVSWLPVGTNLVSGGLADYTDAAALGVPHKFYRGRWVP